MYVQCKQLWFMNPQLIKVKYLTQCLKRKSVKLINISGWLNSQYSLKPCKIFRKSITENSHCNLIPNLPIRKPQFRRSA